MTQKQGEKMLIKSWLDPVKWRIDLKLLSVKRSANSRISRKNFGRSEFLMKKRKVVFHFWFGKRIFVFLLYFFLVSNFTVFCSRLVAISLFVSSLVEWFVIFMEWDSVDLKANEWDHVFVNYHEISWETRTIVKQKSKQHPSANLKKYFMFGL